MCLCSADGTVLFGQGVQRAGDPNHGADGAGLLQILGPAGALPLPDTEVAVADEYVAYGARELRVASADTFAVGDAVVVRSKPQQPLLASAQHCWGSPDASKPQQAL